MNELEIRNEFDEVVGLLIDNEISHMVDDAEFPLLIHLESGHSICCFDSRHPSNWEIGEPFVTRAEDIDFDVTSNLSHLEVIKWVKENLG
jgi:hypothetical protein